MADSVDRVFSHALNTVKKIPRTGSARPPPSDRLKLYGLYKQSMEGDVDGVMDRPLGDGDDLRAERDKWDAWKQKKGISRTEAKRRYISTLIDTMHKYASTTPDARELVSELEFVWDQIKSNNASNSSGSSPQQRVNPALPQSRIYTQQARDGGPLRILSPISQDDEESGMSENFEDEGDQNYDEEDQGDSLQRRGEVRNRKWRQRIETALVRMTAEMAALREQVESRRSLPKQRRKGIFGWFAWIFWKVLQHMAIDLVILGLFMYLVRGRGDRRLEDAGQAVINLIKEQVQRMRIRRRR